MVSFHLRRTIPAVLLLFGCSGSPPQGSPPDNAVVDASSLDAVLVDAAPGDVAPADSAPRDGSSPDLRETAQAAPDGPVQVREICPTSGCQGSLCCPSGGGQCPATCEIVWKCGLASLCPHVSFSQPFSFFPSNEPYKLDNPEAAACVLRALRDGLSGQVSWGKGGGGPFRSDVTLDILPNRLALLRTSSQQDTFGMVQYAGPYPLREPAYYEDCLLKKESDQIRACLGSSLGKCGPP